MNDLGQALADTLAAIAYTAGRGPAAGGAASSVQATPGA
jgi:hypothetical protein